MGLFAKASTAGNRTSSNFLPSGANSLADFVGKLCQSDGAAALFARVGDGFLETFRGRRLVFVLGDFQISLPPTKILA
jgi:hypothetical protein